MIKHSVHQRKHEKGQSFVELGLSIVFLLILLSAVIDLGWAFFSMVALRDAVQEAATVGSICPTDYAKIRSRFKSSASAPLNLTGFADTQIQICKVAPGSKTCLPEVSSSLALGNSIQVTVTYNHQIVTPFVGSFIGTQTYPLTARAADTILRLDCSAIQ